METMRREGSCTSSTVPGFCRCADGMLPVLAEVDFSQKAASGKYVCSICGYVYEGEELPADFVCPICKHGAADFEPIA